MVAIWCSSAPVVREAATKACLLVALSGLQTGAGMVGGRKSTEPEATKMSGAKAELKCLQSLIDEAGSRIMDRWED